MTLLERLQGEMVLARNGDKPVLAHSFELAIEEINDLRATLRIADEAINPKDLGGISLDTWNKRLKTATKVIRAALA